eukprot:8831336-Pyramimonas_sp.AAC.1
MWCPAVSRGAPKIEIDSESDRCSVVSRGVPLSEIDCDIDSEVDMEIDVGPRGVPSCPKK